MLLSSVSNTTQVYLRFPEENLEILYRNMLFSFESRIYLQEYERTRQKITEISFNTEELAKKVHVEIGCTVPVHFTNVEMLTLHSYKIYRLLKCNKQKSSTGAHL
jgi:hypothetical protein